MIITEVKCSNFFRFYGDCVVNCDVDGEKNVTVIRGENGTGKTTMLNAFYYCLYGDVTPPLYVSKMLNELAEHGLQEGGTAEAKVEITFIEKGIIYTAIRKRTFVKRNGEATQLGDEDFDILKKDDKTGNSPGIRDPHSFFESIIPNNLRGFFFFDGERIDRLAKVDGRDEIREAILNILGLTKLENLKGHLEQIVADLTREQRRYQTDTGKDLNDDYNALRTQKVKMEDNLTKVKDDIRMATENINRISDFLSNFNSATINALEENRKNTDAFEKRLTADIKAKNKELMNLATRKFKHNLVAFAFDDVFAYLESKREKGELPSDIKEQFIDDLLKKQLCICERELKQGEAAYEAVLRKKANAGRTELDNAYLKITAYIKQQKANVEEFFSLYFNIKGEITGLEAQKDIQVKRLAEIKKGFDESKIEQVRLHEEERSQLQDDLERYRDAKVRLEYDIENQTKKIESKLKEIQSLEARGEQEIDIKKRRDTVMLLGQLNQEMRTYFMDTTRSNLDERIREVFDSMKEKSYRFARLTDDFVLEITNDLADEDDRRVLSTGEGQIASLAFIASLVSYAREKMHSKLLSDFGGGDFPIVMDSPFGNLSAGHKQNVAREIGNLASQVIVVVSDEQWTSTVERNIMPRVNMIYQMSDGSVENQNVGEHTVVRRAK